MADMITMAHGSGGTQMHQLIEDIILRHLGRGNELLLTGNDAAVFALDELAVPGARLAFSTDSYVVTPYFFPDANIGQLAVSGTVNDLATSGARPLYLSLGLILEEGLPLKDLELIVAGIVEAAEQAEVKIVTGDTKVVERGKGDGIYINTSGIGVIAPGIDLSGHHCRPGDVILLSGSLGDHGIAIVSRREGLSFSSPIVSDVAPLGELVAAVLKAAPRTRCFRDPTRGGLASTLSELAKQSNTCMIVDESRVPVKDAVRGASDLLGYDLFHLANEGKMVAIVPADEAEQALAAMHGSSHGYGADAAIIGRVVCQDDPELPQTTVVQAYVRTVLGTLRVMDVLGGEQLPRIC